VVLGTMSRLTVSVGLYSSTVTAGGGVKTAGVVVEAGSQTT
jgi:hypothetical protein